MFAARNAIDSRFVSVIVLISGAAWPRPCLRRALCPAAGRAPRQLRALVLPLSLPHGCRAGHRNLPALPVRGRDVIDKPESQDRPHGHFGDGSISAGGARVAAGAQRERCPHRLGFSRVLSAAIRPIFMAVTVLSSRQISSKLLFLWLSGVICSC